MFQQVELFQLVGLVNFDVCDPMVIPVLYIPSLVPDMVSNSKMTPKWTWKNSIFYDFRAAARREKILPPIFWCENPYILKVLCWQKFCREDGKRGDEFPRPNEKKKKKRMVFSPEIYSLFWN